MSNFLDTVMNKDIRTTLTICGSAKNRELKEKYQAYYTLKNNLIFMPINYAAVEKDVDIARSEAIEILHSIHDKKITISDGIIVVTGNDGYYGLDTLRELDFASTIKKKILFTYVPENEKHKFYFNDNLTYPLYMIKEEIYNGIN